MLDTGPTQLADRLFDGDGEMARRTGAFPWEVTSLGAASAWPQSLRTAVRIMLTSRFAMWMGWGRELTFFYNDAYRVMTLGAKHPWALGRPAREVWAEIWEHLEPRIAQVLAEGKATWDERLLLFLERSGYREESYHTFSYSPLTADGGETVGMLCVVSEDTERVIGERRLAVLHELATQVTGADQIPQVLNAIARCSIKDARDLPFTLTYLLDEDGKPVLRAVTGLPPGHPAALALGEAEAVPQTLWPLARALESPSPVVVELPPQIAWPTGPWNESPRQAVVVPIPRAGHGQPWGVFIAGLNGFRRYDDGYQNFVGLFVGQVSAALANAQAYEDERRRARALAELDRAKTAFFSNVSHEFRTPLTLMLGPTEDALSSARALEGKELAAVHRNQLRLLKLVNSLLDFSRIEAGRLHASYAPVDLAQLTADLATTFRGAVERAGLRLEVRAEPIAEATFVDVQMWEGIVLNLLSNAFKFTFEGTITVSLEPAEQQSVRLCVSDSGVGIPPSELQRVFERFHRIDGARARTHEGSGIGLALVQDLVKLHGGRIEVKSELGRGTTFSVTLPTGSAHLPPEQLRSAPRARVEKVAAPFLAEALRWLPAESAAAPSGTELDSREPRADGTAARSRILVAEDNADMRDYLTRLLRSEYELETVGNGAEALAAARQQRPDLIISDVMMPKLDGFAFLMQLRADPVLRAIPVILLSARAGEDAVVEGIEAGADDYLVKPFSARELLARVRTRLELERLGRRLRDERSSLAALFGQAPLPICVLSAPDLVFESANGAYRKSIGGRELVGRRLLEALPELEGQGFGELLHQVLATGKAYVGYEVPVRLNKSGVLEDAFWTFIYSPVSGDKGVVDRVITIGNDVTEQVLARRRLEALAHEAASANRAKDEFLAMLGHELRNPLAPMVTALQLMRMRGRASKEQEVLERQVAHLARLVDDLLDVSRIARGKIDLDCRSVEVCDVIVRAMEVSSPMLEQSHHRVELQVPRAGLLIHADLNRMAQVISNLLTNAAKYSDPHSLIRVNAERVGPSIRISVKDQGIGIAPEMMGGIFDAFVQQPQTIDRARGGLGLGLTIVRSFVERHGGQVRAESAGIGHGSEFIVELPAAEGRADTEPGPAEPLMERPRALRDKRILVVDDNEDAAVILMQALEQLGYQVKVAHDGPSALDTCQVFRPDVALLDIGLPVMDGYELAQRLRESCSGEPHLRLVAITGYGQDKDRERSRRAGFEQHLVKPLDLAKIERAIEGPADARP
jgi:signal transduction histidine kinase/ActR/RegA family two-component response regulator